MTMTQPPNDLVALAAKLNLCERTITKHFDAGNLIHLPGIVAIRGVLKDVTTVLQDAVPVGEWSAGLVDCDGNELVTMRADELQKLRDEREKFMWQVRDTCIRAEKAEAALATPKQDVEVVEGAELRVAIQRGLLAELGDTYDCTRVWQAWSVGTMDQDDFVPVLDRLEALIDTIVAEIVVTHPSPNPAPQAVAAEGELLPCPLCNGEARHVKPFFHLGNLCGDYVACNECGCRNYRPHKAGDLDAITAWNTRPATNGDKDAVIDRLETSVDHWKGDAQIAWAQVAALREALEPFARAEHICADILGENIRCVLTYKENAAQTFTLEALDRAKKALTNRGEAV